MKRGLRVPHQREPTHRLVSYMLHFATELIRRS
jgi:hypothetical protein